LLRATERVYVTQSALSLQMKRLEETLQAPLYRRDGRRLTLTPAGETLLTYSRDILSMNDKAVAALTGETLAGPARVGLVQDFAETLLTGVLSRFAKLNGETQLQVRVGGSAELLELLAADRVDVVLCMGSDDDPAALKTTPMVWLGEAALAELDILPLAVLEPPCRFRDAALKALDEAGRPYRIVLETPSLSALRAAVESDICITCRTGTVLKRTIDRELAPGLPSLPGVAFTQHLRPDPHPTVARLAEMIRAAVLEL